MSQTKAQLVVGLNVNASAPASALQIDASGNINLDSNTLYVDAANNRVGVGTSTFSYLANKLVIDKGSTANDGITIVSSTTSNASIWFADGTTGNEAYRGGIDYQHSTDKLFFYSGGSTNVLIDSSGRLGIGTSSPNAILDLTATAGAGGQTSVIRFGLGATAESWIGVANGSGNVIANSAQGDTVIRNDGGKILLSTDSGTTAHAVIDSSGRLGIGTSSPTGQLDVRGSATDFDGLRVLNTNTSSGTQTSAAIRLGITNSFGAVNGIRNCRIQATEDTTDSNNVHLDFYTNSAVALDGETVKMRLTSGGNLGIGTTSPTNKLVVASSGVGYEIDQSSIGNTNLLLSYDRGASAYRAVANYYGGTYSWNDSGAERARIDSSGRLLVGTSSSISNVYVGGASYQSPLQVIGNAAGYGNGLTSLNYSAGGYGATLTLGSSKNATVGVNGALASGDDLAFLNFVGNDGTNFRTGAYIIATCDGTVSTGDVPTRLSFWTKQSAIAGPNERARITQQGFFKATSNGSYYGSGNTFHEIRSGESNSEILYITHTASTNPYGITMRFTSAAPNDSTRYFLTCVDSSATRMQIYSNGGIANYQANNANLSDRNAKKDITPAAGTWDCIKEWEIVNYRYKDQPDDADLNLGVIAQQVAESCPEVITVFQEAKEATEDQPAQEERLGVKEQQMYWMAIKALQEAQVRIEQLEAKVAALESA